MPSALLTDLYELTMMAAYVDHRKDDPATFELSFRALPGESVLRSPERSRQGEGGSQPLRDGGGWAYFIAAGIEDAIDAVTGLRFDRREIAFLETKGLFKPAFFRFLERFRFEGEVEAVREGTPVFPGEPILRVTARRTQAQLVESLLLNTVNFQTMIASKASRMVNAAARGGAVVLEFGLRRAHEEAAAMKGARAAYLAGAAGTSNVQAGRAYGLPLAGTMAHSFVMSFPTEREAFQAYARTFPDKPTLLIDTYDTLRGARNAVAVGRELARAGGQLGGVRLDSGNLGALAKKVRKLLDAGGLAQARIVASGDLNEYKIAALVRAGAPIDVYGVGTDLISARPVAVIPGIYKLVADGGGGRMKFSPDKHSLPGPKQVFRQTGADGRYSGDVIALAGEPAPGFPLLTPAVRHGRRIRPLPPLSAMRAHALAEVARLPDALREIPVRDRYPVALSPGLEALIRAVSKRSRLHRA